mmetsp:Transcript_32678/g.56811  ORF Transcript_32678/g.56811 Transcript_32678/m.56811 type:complete len:291 (-) Transcript_32678:1343-2215(-)
MAEVNSIIEELGKIYTYLKNESNKVALTSATQTENLQPRQRCAICILPRAVLRTVFLFLDFYTDIPTISETCTLFHSITKSRSFHISLFSLSKPREHRARSVKSGYSETSTNMSMEDVEHVRRDLGEMSREELQGQLKLANSVKKVLGEKLRAQEKKIDDYRREVENLNDNLRIQQQINSKTFNKISQYQKQFEEQKVLAEERTHQLNTLREQALEDQAKLSDKLKKLEDENDELMRHKKVLKSEVFRLRGEHKSSLVKIGEYRDALGKMKTYFDAMFVPQVQSSISAKH